MAKGPKPSISKEQYEIIVKDYKNSTLSLNDIAIKYNISKKILYTKLYKDKLFIKAKSQCGKTRIYTLNENYFKEIDTQEKAYWLGFLYADGYVNKKKNCLQINLSEIDIDHLEKLKIVLNSNQKIRKIDRSKFRQTSQKNWQNVKDAVNLNISRNVILFQSYKTWMYSYKKFNYSISSIRECVKRFVY